MDKSSTLAISAANLAVWNVGTKRRELFIPGKGLAIRAIALSSDGTYLAMGGGDRQIRFDTSSRPNGNGALWVKRRARFKP